MRRNYTDLTIFRLALRQEVHIYMSLVGIGTPPTLLPDQRVGGGGGVHSPAAKGVEESQFRRLEKSLALYLLCALGYLKVLSI